VHGAAPWQIYLLFIGKFGRWLVLGFIFGALPAVYLLNQWLQNYPERVDLNWTVPVLAVLLCGGVCLTVITLLLVRVMRLNPAVYLRDE